MKGAGVVLLLALAGCAQQADPKAVEASARAALNLQINDAESARFVGLQSLDAPAPHRGKLICGLINAKNAFGAYTGFRRFVAYPDEGIASFDTSQESGAEQRAFNVERRAASKAGCTFTPA